MFFFFFLCFFPPPFRLLTFVCSCVVRWYGVLLAKVFGGVLIVDRWAVVFFSPSLSQLLFPVNTNRYFFPPLTQFDEMVVLGKHLLPFVQFREKKEKLFFFFGIKRPKWGKRRAIAKGYGITQLTTGSFFFPPFYSIFCLLCFIRAFFFLRRPLVPSEYMAKCKVPLHIL